MNVRMTLIPIATILALLSVGCFLGSGLWGRMLDNQLHIEDGGLILSSKYYTGYEVDLDSGTMRPMVRDTDLVSIYTRLDPHRGCLWARLTSDDKTIAAISPYADMIEKHTIATYKGKKVSQVGVLGSVSPRFIVVDFAVDRSNVVPVCLYNTNTGEMKEIWKYSKDLGYCPVWVPIDGSLIERRPTDEEKKKGIYDFVYDMEKNQWMPFYDNFKLAESLDERGNLSGSRLSHKAIRSLTRKRFTPQFSTPKVSESDFKDGNFPSWLSVWRHNSKTGKMESLAIDKADFRILWCWDLSPDGRRVFLWQLSDKEKQCFIYDLSTGIVAQIPELTRTGYYSAGWSPSGRYLAYYRQTRSDMLGFMINDLYVANVETGEKKMVLDGKEANRSNKIIWFARPVAKREVNINYAKWLVSLLDKGVEKKKITERLQEFTSRKKAIKAEEWKKWLEENEDYLAWSEKEKRLYLCAEAKSAKTHVDVWETIPEGKRTAWSKLSEQEQKALRDKAASDLSARRKLEKTAWRAGVDPEVWVHIPEEKQKNWPELKTEERIKLVAEGKKKWLKEVEKPATNNGKDVEKEKAEAGQSETE